MLHRIPGKYALLVCLASLVFTYSCKKEYTAYPYNTIEKFTITDTNGAELKATIQGENIIIYYPPFQTPPDSIKPQITVSDRATIQPASGTKVAFKAGLTYSVTAQDGSVKIYTLQSAINQPPLTFLTSDTHQGDWLALTGQYFVPDTINTKIFLIGKDNKEIKIPGSLFSTLTASKIIADLPPSVRIDTGHYKVKMISGQRTSVQGPIFIDLAYLKPVFPNITTIKRGDEYTITDASGFAVMKKKFGESIKAGLSILINYEVFVPVVVTKLTDTECTFRIPANCPPGSFFLIYGTNPDATPNNLFTIETAEGVTVI